MGMFASASAAFFFDAASTLGVFPVPDVHEVTESHQPDLITVKQAAAYAGCSTSTVKRRVYSGELPAYRIGAGGRKLYVSEQDVAGLFERAASAPEERLRAIARSIAAEAPKLSAERKARLRELLS